MIASGGALIRSKTSRRAAIPSGVSTSVLTRRSPGAAPPLEEASRLESVDEPGDVRGVAGQRLRKLPHRRGAVRVEAPQDDPLDRREVELGHPGYEIRAGAEHNLPEGSPGLPGVRTSLSCDGHRAHYS